jgi:Zn-finger domain-containing protein
MLLFITFKETGLKNWHCLMFFSEENLGQEKVALTKLGVKWLNLMKIRESWLIFRMQKDPAVILSDLAQIHGVKQIEEVKIPKLFNSVTTGIMNANSN